MIKYFGYIRILNRKICCYCFVQSVYFPHSCTQQYQSFLYSAVYLQKKCDNHDILCILRLVRF